MDFEEAKNQLLPNINFFKDIDEKQWPNKYMYGEPPFEVLSANKGYFKNTEFKSIQYKLNEVDELWDKNYLEGRYHNIILNTDSTIWFKIVQTETFDSNVYHSLVFSRKEKLDEMFNNYSFDRKRRINGNWLQASWRNYKLVELLNM